MKPVHAISSDLKHEDVPQWPRANAPVVIDENTRKVVDALFDELQGIFPAWRQAWPTNAVLARAKRTWTKGFMAAGLTSLEQLRFGLKRCREPGRSDFIPSVGRFLEWCQPSPEDLGQPPLVVAYRQAVRKSHPHARFSWTHQTIFHAAYEVGLDRLYAKPSEQTFEPFAKAYREACQLMLKGEPLRALPERDEDAERRRLKLPAPVPDPAIAREQLAAIRARMGRGSA